MAPQNSNLPPMGVLSRAFLKKLRLGEYDPLVFEACLEGRALGVGVAFHAAGKVLDDLLTEN